MSETETMTRAEVNAFLEARKESPSGITKTMPAETYFRLLNEITLLNRGADLEFNHTCPPDCAYCAWVDDVNKQLGTNY